MPLLVQVEGKLRSSAERLGDVARTRTSKLEGTLSSGASSLSSSANKLAGTVRKGLHPAYLSLRGVSSTEPPSRPMRADKVFAESSLTSPAAPRRDSAQKSPATFPAALLPSHLTVDAIMAASHADICAMKLENESAVCVCVFVL